MADYSLSNRPLLFSLFIRAWTRFTVYSNNYNSYFPTTLEHLADSQFFRLQTRAIHQKNIVCFSAKEHNSPRPNSRGCGPPTTISEKGKSIGCLGAKKHKVTRKNNFFLLYMSASLILSLYMYTHKKFLIVFVQNNMAVVEGIHCLSVIPASRAQLLPTADLHDSEFTPKIKNC